MAGAPQRRASATGCGYLDSITAHRDIRGSQKAASMHRQMILLAAILVGLDAVFPAGGAEVATYGTGLRSCSAYVQAVAQDSADEVQFVDWLSGYMSGANATARHRRNNLLGMSDLKGAMYWLGDYCRGHTSEPFARAVGMLAITSSAQPDIHAPEVTDYGSGFKGCRIYVQARREPTDNGAEFRDWLAGYLSGVNALSISTDDVLGGLELAEALHWLDAYCEQHPPEPYASAVAALVTARGARLSAAAP